MKKIWDKYKEFILYYIVLFVVIASIAAIGYFAGYNKGKKQREVIYTSPVEKKVIDTLYITRQEYITKIEYLEVIKHDTIEKVYMLDDSSTVELFYKLVSK